MLIFPSGGAAGKLSACCLIFQQITADRSGSQEGNLLWFVFCAETLLRMGSHVCFSRVFCLWLGFCRSLDVDWPPFNGANLHLGCRMQNLHRSDGTFFFPKFHSTTFPIHMKVTRNAIGLWCGIDCMEIPRQNLLCEPTLPSRGYKAENPFNISLSTGKLVLSVA